MQLYYMSKDGNRGSDSTVVLMTVAVVYKFVLVILGAGILICWHSPLQMELGKFFPLYLFGLFLNVILVVIITGVMLFPNIMLRCALFFEKLLVRMRILKRSDQRAGKIHEFIGSYQKAVEWLRMHKGKLLFVIFVTFLQRCSVFLLTYMVYLGLSPGTAMRKVILHSRLQDLYCSRYASTPRSTGDYRADVSNSIRSCVYRSISDPFHACEQRNQFLFFADR